MQFPGCVRHIISHPFDGTKTAVYVFDCVNACVCVATGICVVHTVLFSFPCQSTEARHTVAEAWVVAHDVRVHGMHQPDILPQ